MMRSLVPAGSVGHRRLGLGEDLSEVEDVREVRQRVVIGFSHQPCVNQCEDDLAKVERLVDAPPLQHGP